MDIYEQIARILIRKDQYLRIVFYVPMDQDCAAGVVATEPHSDDEELDFFLISWQKGLADFLRAKLPPGATP